MSVYGGSRDPSLPRGARLHRAQFQGASVLGGCPVGGGLVILSVAGTLAPTSSNLLESSLSPSAPPPRMEGIPVKLEVVTIKDKPSDLGIRPINNKESWVNAKKIIKLRLCCPPYWAGPSGNLITMEDIAAASGWWKEVLAFFCKPPMSNLFVGENRFDEKGFERITYINCHFHPSGALDCLGYIFDLTDIKQKDSEPVVSLKACFSKAFSALKLGGIPIDSALQVLGIVVSSPALLLIPPAFAGTSICHRCVLTPPEIFCSIVLANETRWGVITPSNAASTSISV